MFRIILLTALVSQTLYGKIACGQTITLSEAQSENKFLNRVFNATLQKSFFISFVQLNVNDCQHFCGYLQSYFGVRPDCNWFWGFHQLKNGSAWRKNECGSWCEQALSCDIGHIENCPSIPACRALNNLINVIRLDF